MSETTLTFAKGSDTSREAAERMAQKPQRIIGECLIWTKYINPGGYGRGWDPVEKKVKLAHRIFYERKFGEIPAGLQIDHLCRNRACVNPDHLEAVTQHENIRRGEGGRNSREKTHCPQGHEYTEDNTYVNQGRRNCRACAKETAAERQRRYVERRGADYHKKRWADMSREQKDKRNARRRERRAEKRRGELERYARGRGLDLDEDGLNE